jgi:hypothetical protein
MPRVIAAQVKRRAVAGHLWYTYEDAAVDQLVVGQQDLS